MVGSQSLLSGKHDRFSNPQSNVTLWLFTFRSATFQPMLQNSAMETAINRAEVIAIAI